MVINILMMMGPTGARHLQCTTGTQSAGNAGFEDSLTHACGSKQKALVLVFVQVFSNCSREFLADLAQETVPRLCFSGTDLRLGRFGP